MPNALWEGRSILQIARRFKFRELIAHDCSQDIFNQFWKGKVKHPTSTLKLYFYFCESRTVRLSERESEPWGQGW